MSQRRGWPGMLATLSVLDKLEDGAGEMLVRLSDGEAPAQAAPKGEVDWAWCEGRATTRGC